MSNRLFHGKLGNPLTKNKSDFLWAWTPYRKFLDPPLALTNIITYIQVCFKQTTLCQSFKITYKFDAHTNFVQACPCLHCLPMRLLSKSHCLTQITMVLSLCLLGKFSCFFCCLLIFFKSNFFEKFFQEYDQCRTVWVQIRPDILFAKVISRGRKELNFIC